MWEGEARDLWSSYRVHLRERGPEFARGWVKRALEVMCRRYKVGDEHVRKLMREMDAEQRYFDEWNSEFSARMLQSATAG